MHYNGIEDLHPILTNGTMSALVVHKFTILETDLLEELIRLVQVN